MPMFRRPTRLATALKWVGVGLIVLLLLMVVAAGAAYLYLRTGLPQTEGRLQLAGLEKEVGIYRDRDGVPHIFAAGMDDAYFALGFVHAQDRLFQMDFQRRVGAGRLSEIAGPATLGLDKTMRTLGVYRAVEAALPGLGAETRAAAESYAAGVNAYLAGRSGALPPEYYLLRTSPEPWRPADSLVWGRLMALTLSGNWRGEALRARLSARLTPAQMADLFADDGESGAITLQPAERAEVDRLMQRALAALEDAIPPANASNLWVVDGRFTGSGKPILANDPHLGFSAPGLWYLARIVTPTLQLTGATVAGVPFHVLGHNGEIAWGFTTTTADTQDLFIEALEPGDHGQYRTPDGPRPFATRVERIAVRGADPVEITVRETRHGPVISDIDANAAALAGEGRVIALASTALRHEDRSPDALAQLNRAADWTGFTQALASFDAPMQNIVYADRSGNIGLMSAAKVPIRRSGDGFMPADGSAGTGDWIGYLAARDLPQRLNPAEGYLVNANNRLVGPDYPFFISRDWDLPYRADRILEVLRETPQQTVAAHVALQNDTVSPMATELLPLLLAPGGGSARAVQARRMLAAWDGRMDRRRPEPLILTAWLRALNRLLLADELGDMFVDVWDLNPKLVGRALRGSGAWCDDIRTPAVETCNDQVVRALEDALTELAAGFGDEIETWQWGAAHQARFVHPALGRIPWLARLTGLSTPADGANDTVNRASSRVRGSDPYADVHGAGYRAVYDLGNLDASQFIIATGQSGNLLSPHWDDFLMRWRDGAARPMTGAPAALLAAGADLLTLAPK